MSVIELSGLRQIRVHTAEPLVREASALVVEMAVETEKRCKSPFIYNIPVRFLQSGCNTVFSKFHKHVYSVWNKVKLPH